MECDEVTEQLESMPELLGTVRTSTNDARGAERMAPHEGCGGELRVGGGSCQGPPLSLTGQLFRTRNNSSPIISFEQLHALAQNKINKGWPHINAGPIKRPG